MKGGTSPTWIRISCALESLNLIQIWRILFLAPKGVWFDVEPLSYIRRSVEKRKAEPTKCLVWRQSSLGVPSFWRVPLGISFVLGILPPCMVACGLLQRLEIRSQRYFSFFSEERVHPSLLQYLACMRSRKSAIWISWSILIEELLQP